MLTAERFCWTDLNKTLTYTAPIRADLALGPTLRALPGIGAATPETTGPASPWCSPTQMQPLADAFAYQTIPADSERSGGWRGVPEFGPRGQRWRSVANRSAHAEGAATYWSQSQAHNHA